MRVVPVEYVDLVVDLRFKHGRSDGMHAPVEFEYNNVLYVVKGIPENVGEFALRVPAATGP